MIFAGFEEVVRKLSSSELASFHKTYDLKASIIGKVTVERLLEKDDVVKKLSRESKLKRELNKAQASSIDLEQRFSELADSLKKCQDEKRLAEAALEDSKKDLEKLDKTHEDDLRMIKNLHKDSDKNAKTVDELRVSNAELLTKNFDLAKTLSVKEQKIQDLERALSERSEALGKDVDEIKRNLKLLFEEYKEALKNFGVRPGPFPESGQISDLMDWMQTEFRALPDVISGASDFAAVFSIESILKLLHDFDCVDLVKFHGALSRFPDAGSTASIRPNEDVRAVKMKFAREFWIASGKEFAKKIACDKLEEVSPGRFC
jgi:DNA repair exonuclease SbcCD ATPase subunit